MNYPKPTGQFSPVYKKKKPGQYISMILRLRQLAVCCYKEMINNVVVRCESDSFYNPELFSSSYTIATFYSN